MTKQNWNVFDVEQQIQRMGWAARDSMMTGFVCWPIKQDLYRLKWIIDEELAKSPVFSDEAEFLEEHEKEVMWKALNYKNSKEPIR